MTTRAIAAKLTAWFNDYIDTYKIPPDLKGQFAFFIRKVDWFRYTNLEKIPEYLRDVLLEYGFSLRIKKTGIEVVKFK